MTVPESVALILGSVLVLAAAGTWAWKQVFGTAGAVLLVCGVALVGFPVFGNIRVSAPGVEIRFDERLSEALREDPEATLSVVERSVSSVINDGLQENNSNSAEDSAAAQAALVRWKQRNEEMSNLIKTLHDQEMTPIRDIR